MMRSPFLFCSSFGSLLGPIAALSNQEGLIVRELFLFDLLLENQNSLFTQEVVRTRSFRFFDRGSWTKGTNFDSIIARTCSLSIRDSSYAGRKDL